MAADPSEPVELVMPDAATLRCWRLEGDHAVFLWPCGERADLVLSKLRALIRAVETPGWEGRVALELDPLAFPPTAERTYAPRDFWAMSEDNRGGRPEFLAVLNEGMEQVAYFRVEDLKRVANRLTRRKPAPASAVKPEGAVA